MRFLLACHMLASGLVASATAPVVERSISQRPLAENAHVRAAFTPGDNIAAIIVAEIRAASASIRVQAYLFTSRTIADALVAAAKRGVAVEVVADANEHADGKVSALPRLTAGGVAVYLNDRHKISHNKIILIDADLPRAVVITGSYNFTRAAQTQNAENIVVLSGNPALAKRFLANFELHRSQSTRLQ